MGLPSILLLVAFLSILVILPRIAANAKSSDSGPLKIEASERRLLSHVCVPSLVHVTVTNIFHGDIRILSIASNHEFFLVSSSPGSHAGGFIGADRVVDQRLEPSTSLTFQVRVRVHKQMMTSVLTSGGFLAALCICERRNHFNHFE